MPIRKKSNIKNLGPYASYNVKKVQKAEEKKRKVKLACLQLQKYDEPN